jgi:glycosyltransferase involved in cell wall biosynthesis
VVELAGSWAIHALGRAVAWLVRRAMTAALKVWAAFARRRLPPVRESRVRPFALISESLPPSWSGQSVALSRMLEGIDSENYRLLSTVDYGKARAPNATLEKLPARYLRLDFFPGTPRPPKLGVRSILAFSRIAAAILRRGREIAAIVRQEGCASVIACSGDMYDLPAGFVASKLARVPFVAYVFDDYARNLEDPFDRFVTENLADSFIRGADAVIVPNEFLRDEYRSRYDVSAEIVRNPSFAPGGAALSPVPWPAQPGEIHLLYTGAVYYVHFDAFRNLTEALRGLGRLGVALHVYSAQSPEVLETQGIHGPIAFHGHCAQDEIRRIQREADVLFLPLAFDCPVPEVVRTSAPGKLGEYLASGRPILVHAPADSFLAWYFRTYECGALVDVNDTGAVAETLRRLIDDEAFRSKLIRNAANRAKEDFAPQVARSRLLDLVERMRPTEAPARS